MAISNDTDIFNNKKKKKKPVAESLRGHGTTYSNP
jgi:hypothetical protein